MISTSKKKDLILMNLLKKKEFSRLSIPDHQTSSKTGLLKRKI